MAASKSQLKRKEISFFEGVNCAVGSNLAKSEEMYHATNARCTDIGTLEKRKGTRRLGSALSASANCGLFDFDNTGSTNSGFYRISTVSGSTKIHYLNTSAGWTALTDSDATLMLELGSSSTRYDITNPSGNTFRYTWDGVGTDPDIDSKVRVGSTVVLAAENFAAANNGTFSVTGVASTYFEVTNASGTPQSNRTVGTGSVTVTSPKFSSAVAEGQCFLVNGNHDNVYVTGDGSTVHSSALSTGHLYLSPKAHLVAHYKDRLYLADYINSSGVRFRNGVARSSSPLGIVGLVDGDHDAASTTIAVTDTTYVYPTDSLDVYRGDSLIETLTVSAKTEDTITVNATSNALSSADELWVSGTNSGTAPVFRWAGSERNGVAVKEYDTFKLSGGADRRINMMAPVGEVLMFGNAGSLAVWDDYAIKTLDYGVGPVSRTGWTKALGNLFFMHYTGLYATGGGRPTLMSAKVQKYIDGATASGLEACSMGRKGLSVFAHIGTVTLYNPDGSVSETLSDTVIEYNIQQSNCFVHTGVPADQFATYVSSSDPDRLEFTSTSDGSYEVFEFLRDRMDDRVSSDKEIHFRADTPNITLGDSFEDVYEPHEVIVESERGSGLKCYVSLDNDPFYEIPGEAVKGCTVLKVTNRHGDTDKPPRCRRIRLSFRDSTRKACRLSRVALTYRAVPSRENAKEENNG